MPTPSNNPLKKLIHEIHRRSLWQVLGIYVVGSWVVLQVVGVLETIATLPESGLALGLLILGLPIVLATALVQEGGPIREHDGPTDVSAETSGTGERDLSEAPVEPRPASLLFTYSRGNYTPTWWHHADIYRELGDPAKEREALERIVVAWEDADPELQPRVAEARARLGAVQP